MVTLQPGAGEGSGEVAEFVEEEPLIISAVEAEEEEKEYYYDEEPGAATTEPEFFSEDLTTKVSVATSFGILTNLPGTETLLTKADFVAEAEEEGSGAGAGESVEDGEGGLVSGVVSVLPEAEDQETEVHHDVLLKLKDRIKHGNNWLENFSETFRQLRGLL